METKSVKLEDLIGLHVLTGVSFESQDLPYYDDSTYDASVVLFRLDGITYKAIEDSNDGCRSAMEQILIVDEVVKNTFVGCEVNGLYKEQDDYGTECDIIQFFDIKTGMLVLEIGTDNTDDYYPSFVSNFNPKNMYCNA